MLKQTAASIAHVHNPQTVHLVAENVFVLVEIMSANMCQMTPLQGEDIRWLQKQIGTMTNDERRNIVVQK